MNEEHVENGLTIKTSYKQILIHKFNAPSNYPIFHQEVVPCIGNMLWCLSPFARFAFCDLLGHLNICWSRLSTDFELTFTTFLAGWPSITVLGCMTVSSAFGLMKYPYAKTIHMITHRVITHSIVLVIVSLMSWVYIFFSNSSLS